MKEKSRNMKHNIDYLEADKYRYLPGGGYAEASIIVEKRKNS